MSLLQLCVESFDFGTSSVKNDLHFSFDFFGFRKSDNVRYTTSVFRVLGFPMADCSESSDGGEELVMNELKS